MRQVSRAICFVLADMISTLMMLCIASAACDMHWVIVQPSGLDATIVMHDAQNAVLDCQHL